MERWHPHTYQEHPPPQEPIEEHPPKQETKKQVGFEVEDDLGNNSTLHMDLTTFLAGARAKESDDALSPSTPLSMDPPQPPPNEAPQCHPTHMGGFHPKVPTKTSAAWSQSQSQLKGCQTQWTTLADGFLKRWIGPEPILAGGRKSGRVWSSPWEAAPEDTP